MKNNNKTFLFDKYEVVRPLGQGAFGSVILVRHLSLDQERAIKIIPRDRSDSESTLFEARLLKSFNHPGIPQIFDIEEDESNFYIVEEYICGDSLDQFLLHQPIISYGQFINFSEQLCDIFIYLHSLRPSPVVYRDLKPEHIIVCGNQIKLIDFGIATYVTKNGNNFKNMGNINFSAPEIFKDDTVSPTSDIYSIGMILNYMSKHLSKELSPNIQKIIQKSISKNPSSRFETVEQMASALKNEITTNSGSHLYKKIAVLGSFAGCGCTHIAVSIVSYLNYQGNSAVYIDKDDSCNLQSVSEYDSGIYEKNGYMHYKMFCGIPFYGPGICITPPEEATKVYDYGTTFLSDSFDSSSLMEADLILFVCGGALWHRGQVTYAYEWLTKQGLSPQIITNQCDTKQSVYFAGLWRKKVFNYPTDFCPFTITSHKQSVLCQLLDKKGVSLPFLKRIKGIKRRGL